MACAKARSKRSPRSSPPATFQRFLYGKGLNPGIATLSTPNTLLESGMCNRKDGAFMECHEEGPPRRRHSPVTNPIGKEARDEVCRTRLGVSEGAVVRTLAGRAGRRRGSDTC